MTFEEARFHEILLIAGWNDRLLPRLNRMLEEENPLSNLALELSAAGEDPKQQLSALHKYTQGRPVDMARVGLLVRLDLRGRMDAGEMDAETCMRAMKKIADASDCILEEPWQSMGLFFSFYEEARDGILSMDGLMDCFRRFMEDGAPLASPYGHAKGAQGKTSLLERLRRMLHR